VVIIGSGAIGVEFSTIWNSYGVDVTIVEMLPRIVPLEDEEVSKELEKEFKKRKIKIMTGIKLSRCRSGATGVKVKVSAEGKETVLEADQALVAIGFRPNSKGLGLEEVGVKISERGFVEVNEKMQTNVPGIWAIGDVTGKLMLAHVGSAMGIVAAEHIGGHETVTLDYEMMPRATYSYPQVASFGITEAQAKERGYNIKIGRFPFQPNGKALGWEIMQASSRSSPMRKIRRDPRRAHDRTRSDRTAARTDPRPHDGTDPARDRAQRPRAPHAFRSDHGSGAWRGWKPIHI
jgi:dihydrolipoamide dehydrogenase